MAKRDPDERIQDRLQHMSEALPIVEVCQDIADDVECWWAQGVPEDVIDRRILAYFEDEGVDIRTFLREDEELSELAVEQIDALAKLMQVEAWLVAMVRSIAKTGKPIPFYPFMHGDAFVDRVTTDEPMIWAWASSSTDAAAVAEKFVRLARETFGDQVLKNLKNEDDTAVFFRMHRMGMSYTDIAIQSLRKQHPDIVGHPYRYKVQLKRERERIVKAIRAFHDLWKNRVSEDSIG